MWRKAGSKTAAVRAQKGKVCIVFIFTGKAILGYELQYIVSKNMLIYHDGTITSDIIDCKPSEGHERIMIPGVGL